MDGRARMAVSHLPVEFAKYCKLTKQLRQILRDTQRCFQEINASACDEDEPFLQPFAELSREEEEEISAIVKKPPCIVIFGQSNYGKAVVVNDIFGKTILPCVEYEAHDGNKWRAVRFLYGEKTNVGLSLSCSFELLSNLAAYARQWQTIPVEDLEINEIDEDDTDNARGTAVLDVRLPHTMLKDGGQVLVAPSADSLSMYQLYMKFVDEVVPIFIYAITDEYFLGDEYQELQQLKEVAPNLPVFFTRISPPTDEHGQPLIPHDRAPIRSLQNAFEQHHLADHDSMSSTEDHTEPMMLSDSMSLSLSQSPSQSPLQVEMAPVEVFQALLELQFINPLSNNQNCGPLANQGREDIIDSVLVERTDSASPLTSFSRLILLNHLVKSTSLLNVIHTRCLETFILIAFDMARDMMITPRRLEYAQEKENDLYNSLMDIALKKQDEIRRIIGETINDIRDELLDKAANYEFQGVSIQESGELYSPKELKICTGQIQELVIGALNNAIAGKLLGSLDIFRDSCTGVLTRCLESLERPDKEVCEQIRTSMALREILNAAYQVEITFRAGSSIVRVLLEKMKQLIQAMPWKTPPKINSEWKRRVASDMIDSLSESRLAKSICAQIKDRLKQSHESFGTALRQLQAKHCGRLERTEEERLKVRKVHAPKVARLALESTSLRDYILYGMPVMGRELGRGQYGVVYACDTWADYTPCAIKSVVPPDDKHWNDLALEFYYTKNVPEHKRIVALRGSVIDYTYGGGSTPAVLLIMDRLLRDFYTGIKVGMDWCSRLQVGIDVVEGIRFLHSQGLVHRDIKLKNVLLDKKNRGKITDLGFCKPEAMMSGSIVGTPIHMAPELFSGKYDNSVDVYAFGILFWYVCAGHVRLPYAFEQCTSKDMLWTSVRRGVRPERLPQFDDECWDLMVSCWDGESYRRPLLGDVEPKLKVIIEHHRKLAGSVASSTNAHTRKNSNRNRSSIKTSTPVRSTIATLQM